MSDSGLLGWIARILEIFGFRRRSEKSTKGTKSRDDSNPALINGIDDTETYEIGEVAVPLPYRQRDDFLSAAEFSFFRVLNYSLGGRAVVLAKVNLADIFFVSRPNENQSFRNKIDRKHVDFLLCDPETMKPRCGLELDDSSHNRPDRQQRDVFVDQVFSVAGLPLVRVPAQAAYNPAGIIAAILPYLTPAPIVPVAPVFAVQNGPPLCPKCGVVMVQREATKGSNAGKKFYGCANYPRCKELVRID